MVTYNALMPGLTGLKRVQQDQAGVVCRFGKFDRVLEPGLHCIIPFGIETMARVYTGEETIWTKPLKTVLNDGIEIEWQARIGRKMVNPEKYLFNVLKTPDDYSWYKAAASALVLPILAKRTYEEVRKDILQLGEELKTELNLREEHWGVKAATVDFGSIEPTSDDPAWLARRRVYEAEQNLQTAKNNAEAEAVRLEKLCKTAAEHYQGNAAEYIKVQAAKEALAGNSKVVVASGGLADLLSAFGEKTE